jgi:hypothetical protein
MAVIKAMLLAERTGQRRRLKRHTASRGQLAVAAWLTVVILIRLSVNSVDSLHHILSGSIEIGLALLSFNVLHALLVVFLFTFSVSAMSSWSAISETVRLRLSPVPPWTMAAASLAAHCTDAIGVNAAAFALPAFIPILFLGHPVPGLLSLAAILAGSYLLALVFADAVSRIPGSEYMAGVFRVLFVIAMTAVVAANPSFRFGPDHAEVIVLGSISLPLLIADKATSLLTILSLPSQWVLNAATDQRPLPWLCGNLAAGILPALAYILLHIISGSTAAVRVLRATPGHRRAVIRMKPGKLLLLVKELRYLSSDTAMFRACALSAGFTLWSLFGERAIAVPVVGSCLIFSVIAPYAANLFGHDASALLRLAMAAPDWRRMLLARKAAFCLVAGTSLVPLAIAILIRFGFSSFLAFAVSAAAVALSIMIAGDIVSITLPFARTLPTVVPQGEPLLNQFLAPFALGLVFAIHHVIAPFGSRGFLTATAVLFILLSAAFFFVTMRIGTALAEDIYGIVAKMR